MNVQEAKKLFENSSAQRSAGDLQKALKVLERATLRKYEKKYKNVPPQFRPGTWGIPAQIP